MYTASGSKAYAQIGVESAVMSASQQQLVTMLFDGVLSALVRARLFTGYARTGSPSPTPGTGTTAHG